MENILYGGYEGTFDEVCEGAKSLGEALFNKLRTAGRRIVLVNLNVFFFDTYFIYPFIIK